MKIINPIAWTTLFLFIFVTSVTHASVELPPCTITIAGLAHLEPVTKLEQSITKIQSLGESQLQLRAAGMKDKYLAALKFVDPWRDKAADTQMKNDLQEYLATQILHAQKMKSLNQAPKEIYEDVLETAMQFTEEVTERWHFAKPGWYTTDHVLFATAFGELDQICPECGTARFAPSNLPTEYLFSIYHQLQQSPIFDILKMNLGKEPHVLPHFNRLFLGNLSDHLLHYTHEIKLQPTGPQQAFFRSAIQLGFEFAKRDLPTARKLIADRNHSPDPAALAAVAVLGDESDFQNLDQVAKQFRFLKPAVDSTKAFITARVADATLPELFGGQSNFFALIEAYSLRGMSLMAHSIAGRHPDWLKNPEVPLSETVKDDLLYLARADIDKSNRGQRAENKQSRESREQEEQLRTERNIRGEPDPTDDIIEELLGDLREAGIDPEAAFAQMGDFVVLSGSADFTWYSFLGKYGDVSDIAPLIENFLYIRDAHEAGIARDAQVTARAILEIAKRNKMSKLALVQLAQQVTSRAERGAVQMDPDRNLRILLEVLEQI